MTAKHLEFTESMSFTECMLAIRRFVALRGVPTVIYSDNAKTFAAAAAEVQRSMGHLAPQWRFIITRSSWWG